MPDAQEAAPLWTGGIKAAFSWRKLPGHAIWILGAAWKLLDVGGRLDMLSRVTEAMGGEPAVAASILLSPWTSAALIIGGLSYVVFVGEPRKGVLRQSFWPYIGLAIFCLTLLSMVYIVANGAIELYGRREYARGLAGAPRSSPANPQVDLGKPLYSGPRDLTANQQRILIAEAARLRSELGKILVAYLDTDMESWAYAGQLRTAFARAAVQTVGPLAQNLGDPNWSDVLIEVKDPSDPPREAQRLQQIMTIIDVKSYIVKNDAEMPGYPVVLFVGPREIQR